ncbi:unnamed protein product, partial [Didymodactylos carnosus]
KKAAEQEVKVCYQCKGAQNCKPENLHKQELKTSGAFGGKNLYCYSRFGGKVGHGRVVERGAFGFGETFDKNVKCNLKHFRCCFQNLCNNHTTGSCAD